MDVVAYAALNSSTDGLGAAFRWIDDTLERRLPLLPKPNPKEELDPFAPGRLTNIDDPIGAA